MERFPEPIYAYIDEAGDLNFKGNGSKHFIMTCAVMTRPFDPCLDLMVARYDLIESGDLSGCFHASEDRQAVRDTVFGIISSYPGEYNVYSVIAEKSAFVPGAPPREVYRVMFDFLIQMVVKCEGLQKCDNVIVITDDIPLAARKENIKGALKSALRKYLDDGTTYRLIHQRSEGDFNLQIADYLCWAMYRKVERGDDRPFSIVRDYWVREWVIRKE